MEMKSKYKKILEVAFVLITSVIVCMSGSLFYKKAVEVRKQDAETILKFYNEKIVLEIKERLNFSKSLAEMIAINPEKIDWLEEKFESVSGRDEILFMYFIKENTIKRVFPKEFDKNLGKTLNEMSYVYTLTKLLGEPVVEGPISLQGIDKKGYLFLNPIMYKGKYWGEVVVALDEDFVLKQMDLEYLKSKGYEFELWHINSQNGRKNMVAVSDSQRDFSHGAKASFFLPTQWTLSIIPTAGWMSVNTFFRIIITCILVEILLLGSFYYWLKYKKTNKKFEDLSFMELSTGLYSYKGFVKELTGRLKKRRETFALFYFVIEDFNSISQLAGEEQKNEFFRNISKIIEEYIKSEYIIGHIGESNFMIAVFENMEEQAMADITKGLSLELIWKVRLNDKKVFLNTYYRYLKVEKEEENPLECIRKIVEEYYSEKTKKSPITLLTKKFNELLEGKSNVVFDEADNQEMLELSMVLNKYRKQMERIAYYDPIFNIGNRLKCQRDSDILIAYNKKRKFTIFCIDICSFSRYNELFNIETGDEILKETSKRLVKLFGDYTYRINGDVFLGISFSKKTYDEIVGNIREKLTEPIYVNGLKFILKVNIGICIYPIHGNTSEKLLEKVQISLRYAKNYQMAKAVMYDETIDDLISKEKNILRLLEEKLVNGELEVWYQPIWNIKKNTFTSAEALIRLKDDNSGYFPAIQVIEIAEKNGVVEKIGNYVLEHVCKFMRDFGRDFGLDSIGVNTSIQQFLVEDCVDNILKIINKNKISPNNISLEITETLLMSSLDKMNSIILELKKSDISIALDDFGKGYSSLNYLSNLPVDVIKVDKSLVKNIVTSPKQLLILKSIIEMAEINNMKVVVEGIEEEEEQKKVASFGVDYIQGFYYAKPMPEKDLIELLESKK